MNTKYICIEGNLGAGKTTLAKKLAKTLDVTLVLESFLNNPFLKGLYEDIEASSGVWSIYIKALGWGI